MQLRHHAQYLQKIYFNAKPKQFYQSNSFNVFVTTSENNLKLKRIRKLITTKTNLKSFSIFGHNTNAWLFINYMYGTHNCKYFNN